MGQNNLLIKIGAVLLLALVVFILVKKHNQKKPGSVISHNAATQIPQPLVHNPDDLQFGTVPPGIPTDLPMEDGATVIQDQNVLDSQNNIRQSKYVYVTTKTIAENFAAYQKYVAAKQWTVMDTKNDPLVKQITANTGSGVMNIILDYKTAAPNNTVGLYYSYMATATN